MKVQVNLQPEKEARLAEIAAHKGLDAAELAKHVLICFLEDDARSIEAVNIGLAEAARRIC
jgi:hypothetical protein